MRADTNAINWFEIPVDDLERAIRFYQDIFDIKLITTEMAGVKFASFPPDITKGFLSGSLVQGEMHTPGSTGVIIYLNANPNLLLVANKVDNAGGKMILPKTLIDEQSGYMALFTDTEGNTIGLHSFQ